MRGNWILFSVYKKCTKDKEKCKIFAESIYKKTFYSNIQLKYSVKNAKKTPVTVLPVFRVRLWSDGVSAFDGEDLLEDEALSRDVGILVHRVSRFDAGDLAVHAEEGGALGADGEQVVLVVQDTDAEGADPVGRTEHLHVDGLAAVRAGDRFGISKESDGV